MQNLYNYLKTFGRVRANAPLSKYSAFKIGGPAEFLIEVREPDKLSQLLNFVAGEGINYFILGGGSNVLFPDVGLPGVVVKFNATEVKIENGIVMAAAGADLSAVVQAATAAGLTGLEWAAGIPGSVGGAVRGNAGAHYAFTGG